MNVTSQTRWKTTDYSKHQIENAGKTIRNPAATEAEKSNAVHIIDNWRAAHAYPLHTIYINLRSMASVNSDFIVAERLKRLDSIVTKLKREKNMSLWRIQDLGGCRFVASTIDEVYFYANKYETSRKRHALIKTSDYILYPKASGYRSLHMVYKFHSDKNDTYNQNMLIEIQFRTHLQHIWATAVETMGLFTRQALKESEGDEDTKRFFVLVSSLFALREGTPVVPSTDDNPDILIAELKSIDERKHILASLSAIRVALNFDAENSKNKNGYYILILNYDTRRLKIKYYMPSQASEANARYSKIEASSGNSQIDAVLVRVSSFQTLKAAYPNYFLDIGEFVDIVKEYLC